MSETLWGLFVKKLVPEAIIPTRGTPSSAGLDLYTYRDITIPPYSSLSVPTGLAIEIPRGSYGRIASKSSLAVLGIEVGAGVIDNDYRGEIIVLLRNFSKTCAMPISAGSKIAQLIITPIIYAMPVEVPELSSTERGAGGFGSTGK